MRFVTLKKYVCVLGLPFFMACGGNDDAKTDRKSSKPSKEIAIEPKLYLEHSGSMFAYDVPNAKNGQFKNTLVQLIQGFSKVHSKTPAVYIVNDSVYQYPKEFNDLITSKSVFENRVGNPAFTDFKTIFDTILKDLNQNQIAILFSDLIYSGQNSQGKSSQKIRDEAQQLCQQAFVNDASKISVLILKLNSDFNGKYYPYNLPNQGKTYIGTRPYYVCLFAKNETMEFFLKDKKYATIASFEQLPEFQHKIFFTNGSFLKAPYFTILQGDAEAKGDFNKGESELNKNGLHAIKDVEAPHRENEKLTICVAVGFPKGALEESEITNVNNYEIEGFKDNFKLKTVKIVNRTDGTTHKLILEATKIAKGEREITIKFKRKFPPQWVDDTNTEDDTNIDAHSDFASKSFGIRNIMIGLNEALNQPNSNDKNYYFTLNLKIQD